MIKTILLDLDDTIFDFKACERQALSAALDSYSLPYSNSDLTDYSHINDSMWKLLEKGEITREKLKTERFRVFLSRYDAPPTPEVFADRYMQKLANTSALEPGARAVLERLSRSYSIYAVTNGYEFTQKGRIASAKIGEYFKRVFISQKIGAVKPQKAFFDYCVSQIPAFSLQETVLIGDSLSSDISGGNAYGLFTIRYNPKGESEDPAIIPNREIRSLDELPALLKTL